MKIQNSETNVSVYVGRCKDITAAPKHALKFPTIEITLDDMAVTVYRDKDKSRYTYFQHDGMWLWSLEGDKLEDNAKFSTVAGFSAKRILPKVKKDKPVEEVVAEQAPTPEPAKKKAPAKKKGSSNPRTQARKMVAGRVKAKQAEAAV